jgi:WD40 repeat protein
VLLWRGRNCIQLMQPHNSAVTALHYSSATKTLASGGKDGKIFLYNVAELGSSAAGPKKGPQIVQARQIQVSATMDLFELPGILSTYIRSIFLYNDGSKVLVGTFGGEIKELSCLAKNPNISEDDALPPPEEGEEGAGAGVGVESYLGKDINGNSLVRVHFSKELEAKGKDLAVSSLYQLYRPKAALVSSLCKIPGGFLSCGGDGTVRAWAAAEGEPHRCTKIATLDCGCSIIAASATLVAVALDGIINSSRKGVVQIITTDLAFVTDLKVAPGEQVWLHSIIFIFLV